MSGIFRTNKDKNYFYASNEPFNDKRLSWDARGVMGYLLSKPDGWTCRNYDILRQGPAGECKLKRIMAELRRFGYLRRYRQRNEDGTFEWVTEVYESPKLNPTIVSKSTDGLSTDGKPTDIVSTESASTESVNTDNKEATPPPPPALPPVKPVKPIKEDKQPTPAAITAYRQIANRFPDKATWGEVENTVGAAADNLDFWEQVVTQYIAL